MEDPAETASSATVYLIDSDPDVRAELQSILSGLGATCHYYPTVERFLKELSVERRGCIVAELRVGAMSGVELADHLTATGCPLPVVFYTRHATTALTVRSMRSGAVAVIDKGSEENVLWEAIAQALGEFDRRRERQLQRQQHERLFGQLTSAELLVLEAIVDGKQNKEIAITLGVSVRTIETRRRSIFHKLQIDNVPALVRLYCESQELTASS